MLEGGILELLLGVDLVEKHEFLLARHKEGLDLGLDGPRLSLLELGEFQECHLVGGEIVVLEVPSLICVAPEISLRDRRFLVRALLDETYQRSDVVVILLFLGFEPVVHEHPAAFLELFDEVLLLLDLLFDFC